MAQAISGEIACSDCLRRLTCRFVTFRIGPDRVTGFVSHFVYKGTTNIIFEKSCPTDLDRTAQTSV